MPNEPQNVAHGAYQLHDVQVSLENKTATVSLISHGNGMVFANSFHFDPAGNQAESELKRLAIAEAKKLLHAAGDAL